MIFVANYSDDNRLIDVISGVDWVTYELYTFPEDKLRKAIMQNIKLPSNLADKLRVGYTERISISSEFDIYLVGRNIDDRYVIILTGKSVEPLLMLVKEKIDDLLKIEKTNLECIRFKIENYQKFQEKINQKLNLPQTKSDPPPEIKIPQTKTS